MHLIHQKYRPDIDGLRSLAILPVVVYHAFPGLVPGGFIGVDIFFVISGYLISTIIFSSLEHNRFSILEFYIRRIRRILPALTLVLLASIIAGWYLLLPNEFESLGLHVAASAAFFQNIMLWNEVGYFDDPANSKPLLHIWSLAVEEQFYVVWPILIIVTWKYKQNFLWITTLVTIISFAVNINLSSSNSSSAFYLPLPRFWELMIGAILAYIYLHKPKLLGAYENTKSFIGVALILLSLVLINDTKIFPGWYVVLPVLGTALLISSSNNAWLNSKIFSNKLMVGMGKISYPLYLWHWPLLSYIFIVNPEPSSASRLIIIIIAVALSITTYFFVEFPFRKKGSPKARSFALLLLITITGLIGSYIWKSNGELTRIYNEQHELLDKERNIQFSSLRKSDGSCEKYNNLIPVKREVCLSNTSEPEILFVGDSHAMALYSSILTRDVSLKAILIAGHSCAMFPNLTYAPDPKKPWRDNCTRIARHAIFVGKAIKSIKTVVIVNNKGVSYEPVKFYNTNNIQRAGLSAFVSGFTSLIKSFQSQDKNIVFVEDIPWLKYMPYQCVSRLPFLSDNSCDVKLDEFYSRKNRTFYHKSVQMLKKCLPDLKIYDTTKVLCQNDICKSKLNGQWLYFDKDHLTITGSKYLLSNMLETGYL